MGEFKRSPSKVWWGNETENDWRTSSSSPGSQDSGFSDSEIHQNAENRQVDLGKRTIAQRIPKDIFKELSNTNNELNLSSNYKEKTTPSKNSPLMSDKIFKNKEQCLSEPTKKNRYTKYSPKVSRSLFTRKRCSNELLPNQYAESDEQSTNTTHSWPSVTSNSDDSNGSSAYDYSLSTESDIEGVKSLPNPINDDYQNFHGILSNSAPPILENDSDDEGVTAFNESFSDSECERELEDLFNDLESPKHTSTPKADAGMEKFKSRSVHMNLLLKFQKERVPPIHIEDETDDRSVVLWLQENKSKYDPECMISLQSKSIAAELNEKVSYLANSLTARMREMLICSNHIETEWGKVKSIDDSSPSDIKTLIGSIIYYFKTYNRDLYGSILKQFGNIQNLNKPDLTKILSQLYNLWHSVHEDLYTESVKHLLSKLEFPASEIELKATVTGITLVAVTSESVVDALVKYDAIPMLLIQCEKCEGSSVRCIILRALATLCCTTAAVRHFEKYSGIQLVTDILEEDSRPEPERSEAVTLLAQVTAPWIEDNYSMRGLPEYSKRLVRSLTKFLKTTKCCQNLLLCAAALSNLSAMDPDTCIESIISENSIEEILKAIKHRGSASVYILEQVASLIANVSAVESTRSVLIDLRVPAALLCFLQVNNVGEDVEKRVQQKAMIALSRLCGDQRAAKQIVETGGVNKLVKLCREKEDRFNSDAVLVAALASLRKIVETCGRAVISSQDSQELVEPKLLDSFLAYSNQNESYV